MVKGQQPRKDNHMYHPEKLSYKNIKATIEATAWELVPFEKGEQSAQMALLGYFTPSQANWSYQVGISSRGGKVWMLVKVHGGVVGAVELYTGSEAEA